MILPSTNTTPMSILASDLAHEEVSMKSSPVADSVDTAANDDWLAKEHRESHMDMLNVSMAEDSTMMIIPGISLNRSSQQNQNQ
jgi:hypothetical protein